MTDRLSGTLPVDPPELNADHFAFDGIGCWVAGQGRPLLLVHSVNAAASAAEMRPVFDWARSQRTVFAIDLPGFGSSDRSERRYTPRLMTDALHAVGERIRQRCGHSPVDALALSLGCEFLARAAVEQPDHWGHLALVSPTGLNGTQPRRAPAGTTRAVPGMHAVLSAPLWAGALFRLLTRPAVVRYFLERTWGGHKIDEPLWQQAVASAHQPGALHAPLYFLSGELFSADIHGVYESLRQPVWMSHGIRGDFTDYRGAAIVAQRPNWQLTTFSTGALPYFEEPAQFLAAFDRFLSSPRPGADPAVPRTQWDDVARLQP